VCDTSEPLRTATVTLSGLSLALLACGSSHSSDTSAAASASPVAIVSAAPEAGLPPAAPLPTVARPLSARGAHELSLDHMRRFNDAILGQYPGPRHETVEDTFILISGEPNAPFDDALKVTRDTVNALWHGPLLHRPEQSVVVWITSSTTALQKLLHEHAPYLPNKVISVYDPQLRQIFFASEPAGMGSLAHEIAHPLILEDFSHAPTWVLEGLPAFFETAVFTNGTVHSDGHDMRLQSLRTALTLPKMASQVKLDTLFTLTTDDAFRENGALHFAEAKQALRWLDALGLLWPWYREFREKQLEDPTGERAFQTVVHKTLVEATSDWLTWIGSDEAAEPAK
jgi:hypothetical protein